MENSGFAPDFGFVADGLDRPRLDGEKFRAQRARWAEQPVASVACSRIGTVIANEERADSVLPVRDLTMAADGRLYRRAGGGGLLLSESALGPLLSRTVCPCPGAAGTYLREVPPDRRAAEVNSWLEATPSDREVMLRHRTGRGGREAYAIVSPRYQPYDGDELAATLAAAVSGLGDVRAGRAGAVGS